MLLLKRRRKTEKDAFNPNLEQSGLCPVLLPVPAALHNILSFCKVDAAIMSVFLSLHYFYLQKSY